MKFIDNNHYRISDQEAVALAKAVGKEVPKHGWEIYVRLPDGRFAWMNRTPYTIYLDAPKRGWVWCVRPIYNGFLNTL